MRKPPTAPAPPPVGFSTAPVPQRSCQRALRLTDRDSAKGFRLRSVEQLTAIVDGEPAQHAVLTRASSGLKRGQTLAKRGSFESILLMENYQQPNRLGNRRVCSRSPAARSVTSRCGATEA
jgi:hypothetical protein